MVKLDIYFKNYSKFRTYWVVSNPSCLADFPVHLRFTWVTDKFARAKKPAHCIVLIQSADKVALLGTFWGTWTGLIYLGVGLFSL